MKLDGYGKHAGSVVFRDRPFLITWQVRHSPALRDPYEASGDGGAETFAELTTAEGVNLLGRIAQHRTGIVILTGGQSLRRSDLLDLIRHAKRLRLKVGLSPAPIRLLTRARLRALAEAGLDQLILPLDAPSASAHDGLHHAPGSFAKTLARVADAHELRLPVQIDTHFARWNLPYRDEIGDLVGGLHVAAWEVSFAMPRASADRGEAPRAREVDDVFGTVYRIEREHEVWVKLREAPHYHRFIQQKEGLNPWLVRTEDDIDPVAACAGISRQTCSATQAADAGKAALFIDDRGNIYPSAQLRVCLGNVRTDALAAVYRQSPILREIRNPTLLKGKCGFCELRKVCGGSRARAYAASGDCLGPDPACTYIPANLRGDRRHGA